MSWKASNTWQQRHHWARVAALGVTQHLEGIKGDELEGEAGVPGCLDGWAVALGLGDGGVVQCLGVAAMVATVPAACGGRDWVFATTLSRPAMCWMSPLNSAT
jgi:hypothetical protein